MNLPPALASWGPYLQEFPFEVGPALGQLAHRMAALLGPAGQSFDQPEGDVDGYDGLARRGLPERMLLSDWMLAQEAPDEWARRAAEGELSYLQLARRAPQLSKVVGVIFDAGPDALGAPRLGQLAALVVLARRAREMGAELKWGIVQKPTSQLWHDLSPSGANALLAARGCPPPLASDIEAWRGALEDCDERWLVGGQGIAALVTSGESLLQFDDPFEAVHALDVVAHSQHGYARQTRLELPPDAICTRLLRDPFGIKNESAAQVRRVKFTFIPQSNLVWVSGHTLVARSKSSGIVALRVPSLPRGGVAKPKHYQFEGRGRIDSVGMYNGSIVIAQLSSQGVQLYNIGGKAQIVPTGLYTSGEGVTQPGSGALSPLWNFKIGEYRPLLFQNGTLYQLIPHKQANVDERGVTEIVAEEVLGVEGFEKSVVALVGKMDSPIRILRLHADARVPNGFTPSENPFTHGTVSATFCGARSLLAGDKVWGGAGAYQMTDGWFLRWKSEEKMRFERAGVTKDETVFGVVNWKSRWSSPSLLVRGSQGDGLMLRGLGWHHPLVVGEPIEDAVVSPSTPYIAWRTDREVAVYSVALDTILARWQWGETA